MFVYNEQENNEFMYNIAIDIHFKTKAEVKYLYMVGGQWRLVHIDPFTRSDNPATDDDVMGFASYYKQNNVEHYIIDPFSFRIKTGTFTFVLYLFDVLSDAFGYQDLYEKLPKIALKNKRVKKEIIHRNLSMFTNVKFKHNKIMISYIDNDTQEKNYFEYDGISNIINNVLGMASGVECNFSDDFWLYLHEKSIQLPIGFFILDNKNYLSYFKRLHKNDFIFHCVNHYEDFIVPMKGECYFVSYENDIGVFKTIPDNYAMDFLKYIGKQVG